MDHPVNQTTFDECSICLENILGTDKMMLSCKHTYHSECIIKWLINKETCPFCRRYVEIETLKEICWIIGNYVYDDYEYEYWNIIIESMINRMKMMEDEYIENMISIWVEDAHDEYR